MALTFAGIPLCDGTTPAHPDVQSWLEWQRVNLRAQNVFPLDINTWHGIAKFGGYGPDMLVRPQVLYWPVGATRWAHFHVIANQDQVDEIFKKAPSGTATLRMTWYDESATLLATVAPSMTLLSPKPISEVTGDGLFLLSFVDDRYFWWLRQTESTGTSDVDYTWEAFFDAIASQLGISPSKDSVASVYSNASMNVNDAIDFAPAALDMCAFYFGQRIARSIAGTVYTRTPSNSKTDANANNTTGDSFGTCRAGGSFNIADLHASLPSVIKLHFPRSDNDQFDAVATSTGPYAATGSRTVATAGTTLVALSVAELVGITGNGKTKDLLTTYQADYSSGSLSNGATMDSLTAQMASDYYLWSILRYDKKWTGIIALDPDCYHDIEWTYSGEEVSTRMIPFQYEGLFHSSGIGGGGAVIFANQVTFSSTVIMNGPIRQKRYAVTISANTDNLAVGTTNGSWVDATTSGGSYNLTGMTGGSDGRIVEVTNNQGGSGNLTIVHNATSTAANRFYCPESTNIVLKKGEGIICKYSSAESRWIVIAFCCSPLTTKGDLFTYSTDDTRLAVGTDTYRLQADSSTSTGLAWKQTDYACSVLKSTSTTVSGSSSTTVGFNATDRYDTDTMHDTSTNNTRITFNTAGKYLVTLNMNAVWEVAPTDKSSSVDVVLNVGETIIGTWIDRKGDAAGAESNHESYNVSIIRNFSAADYIQLNLYNDGDQSLTFATNDDSFNFQVQKVDRGG